MSRLLGVLALLSVTFIAFTLGVRWATEKPAVMIEQPLVIPCGFGGGAGVAPTPY